MTKKDKPEMTTEEARQVLEADRAERQRLFIEEVNELSKKYNCKIEAQIVIIANE